jgi:hypothetical protein
MQRQGFVGSLAKSRTKSALEVAFMVHMAEAEAGSVPHIDIF